MKDKYERYRIDTFTWTINDALQPRVSEILLGLIDLPTRDATMARSFSAGPPVTGLFPNYELPL